MLMFVACEPVSFKEREIFYAVPSTPTPLPTATPRVVKKKPKKKIQRTTRREIQEAYSALLMLASEHDLLEEDLPSVDARAKRLKDALKGMPSSNVLEDLYRIQEAIPRFELNREFLQKKLKRVRMELQRLKADIEKKKVVEELVEKVDEFLNQENFLDANRLLNGISRDIKMLAATAQTPPTPSPTATPLSTPEVSPTAPSTAE